MFACIHAPDAGALADSFSPWVEIIDARTAVFSITQRQLSVLARISAQTAVAATVEAAILAARNLPGYTFIAPGDEARVLGSLSIDTLPPDPELFQTLDLWGVHSLAELARLPEDGLAGRLGERGLWLQRLARGVLDRPLRPVVAASVYEESAELEHPIDLSEPLLFLIARFLFDLSARMKGQSVAARELRLSLNGTERRLSLPFPTRDVKLLLKLVEHSLERQPPEAAIARVHLQLVPTQPRRVQHGLFTPAAPEPEKLELTLGKIRGLVGEKNVGYPELFDSHRPGAGRWIGECLAFRYFRPALEARVTAEHLSTPMFRGRIVQMAGPWRTSGDWWRADSWDRDEYDLALSDGGVYRLYLDRQCKTWFVEGEYD